MLFVDETDDPEPRQQSALLIALMIEKHELTSALSSCSIHSVAVHEIRKRKPYRSVHLSSLYIFLETTHASLNLQSGIHPALLTSRRVPTLHTLVQKSQQASLVTPKLSRYPQFVTYAALLIGSRSDILRPRASPTIPSSSTASFFLLALPHAAQQPPHTPRGRPFLRSHRFGSPPHPSLSSSPAHLLA